jgi:hypothetical protein
LLPEPGDKALVAFRGLHLFDGIVIIAKLGVSEVTMDKVFTIMASGYNYRPTFAFGNKMMFLGLDISTAKKTAGGPVNHNLEHSTGGGLGRDLLSAPPPANP